MKNIELRCSCRRCGNIDFAVIDFDQPLHFHAMPNSAYHHIRGGQPYEPVYYVILSAAGVDGILSYSRYTATIEYAKMIPLERTVENVRVAVEAMLNCQEEVAPCKDGK